MDRYNAFAVDLDGVVWRGEQIIPGAVKGLSAIIEAGKPFLLLTNNGQYHPERVSERLEVEGLSIRPDQVLTSTVVARTWIAQNGFSGKSAYVLGPSSIAEQMGDLVEVLEIQKGLSPDVVVVGRFTELTYDRLAAGADALRAGAVFLALNNDPIMPVEDGFVPGTGSIVSALEAASSSTPIVMGKPEPPMMQQAAAKLGEDGVLLVGDRLQSDIEGARRNGWNSALVMSGIANNTSALEPRPTYVLESLGDITEEPPEDRAETS